MNERDRRLSLYAPEIRVAHPDTFGMLSLWRVLKRGKLTIAVVTIAFGVLGIWLTISREDRYSAESLLVLEQSTVVPTVFREPSSSDNPIAAVEVYGSRQLISRVVNELNLQDDPEFNPFLNSEATALEPSLPRRLVEGALSSLGIHKADESGNAPALELEGDVVRQVVVSYVEEAVAILADPQSTLIRVRSDTDDPIMAAALANAVSEAFLDEIVSARIASFERLAQQLGTRVAELRGEVREREVALQAALREVGPMEASQVDAIVAEVDRLRIHHEDLEAEREATRALSVTVEALRDLPDEAVRATLQSDPTLFDFAESLGIPATSDANSIAALGREAQDQLDRITRRISTVETSLAELEERATVRSAQLLELQQLRRDVDASTEILDISMRQLNELSLSSGIEGAGGRIIAEAEVPLLPRGNGGTRNTIVLVLLGLILSIGWVLIRESNDPRIRTVSDINAIVRGVDVKPIPAIPRRNTRKPGALRKWLTSSASAAPFLDAVRRIRSYVISDKRDTVGIVIEVTSDGFAEGKSEIAVALAYVAGLVSARILLIEGDVRRRDLEHHLAISHSDVGLAGILSGEGVPAEGCIQSLDDLGIDVLLAGVSSDSPADLFERPAFANLMELLRGHYDVIVIDAPGLPGAPEVAAIASQSDRNVTVLGSNRSTRDTLAEAIEALSRGNAGQQLIALSGA